MSTKIEAPINPILKPLLRGHIHQASFFIAVGAGAMLVHRAWDDSVAALPIFVYVLCLCLMFGISALYHRPTWKPAQRMWMRRLDHAGIFLQIAGTFTPICLVAIPQAGGTKLATIIWTAAAFGVLQSLFFIDLPKVIGAILYVAMGWLAFPYLGEIKNALGSSGANLILIGGVLYTIGGINYALKWPKKNAKYFGYHELFHLFVTLASALHFIAILKLVK